MCWKRHRKKAKKIQILKTLFAASSYFKKIYLSGLIETNSTFERFIYISTFVHLIIAYLVARRMY